MRPIVFRGNWQSNLLWRGGALPVFGRGNRLKISELNPKYMGKSYKGVIAMGRKVLCSGRLKEYRLDEKILDNRRLIISGYGVTVFCREGETESLGRDNEEKLIVITPHNEAVKYEFGIGFRDW